MYWCGVLRRPLKWLPLVSEDSIRTRDFSRGVPEGFPLICVLAPMFSHPYFLCVQLVLSSALLASVIVGLLRVKLCFRLKSFFYKGSLGFPSIDC